MGPPPSAVLSPNFQYIPPSFGFYQIPGPGVLLLLIKILLRLFVKLVTLSELLVHIAMASSDGEWGVGWLCAYSDGQ
jgi:hypothetical protein